MATTDGREATGSFVVLTATDGGLPRTQFVRKSAPRPVSPPAGRPRAGQPAVPRAAPSSADEELKKKLAQLNNVRNLQNKKVEHMSARVPRQVFDYLKREANASNKLGKSQSQKLAGVPTPAVKTASRWKAGRRPPQAVRVALNLLRRNRGPETIKLEQLGPDPQKPLTAALSDPDPEVRKAAVQLLKWLEEGKVLPAPPDPLAAVPQRR